MKNNLLFLFLIVYGIAFSQEKMIHVKITANGNDAAGIDVVNLVNEKSAKSDANGEFQILAKAGDLLIFSSQRYEYKRKIIDEEDLKSKIIQVDMMPKPGQLEEVVITEYRKINAVDLGIMSKHAKEYTPAERRLKAASSYDLTLGTSNSVSLDAIINSISGRTAMLKKELQVERSEFAIASLEQNFETDYFTEKLKIPDAYVRGFLYFVAEDPVVQGAIKEKNKTRIEFYLSQKSVDYLKTLEGEK